MPTVEAAPEGAKAPEILYLTLKNSKAAFFLYIICASAGSMTEYASIAASVSDKAQI